MNSDRYRSQIRRIIPFLAFCFVLSACRDELYFDKYERPDWLVGKVYSQIKGQPELSLFARSLELTGYDTILDVSGSYTVFGPNDMAFNNWLTKHQYSSVENIPVKILEKLVSYHIVQNPWSKIQLRTADIYGWIDTLDESNNKPRGYKRETFLLNDERFYPVKREDQGYIIVKEQESELLRKAIVDSRKLAPFFYREYFDIYDLDSRDYEFFFNRPFEGGDALYFVNAKIISNEIKAENGFVYIIDQVVDPLQNAYQILESENSDIRYSKYLEMVNLFPLFEYNDKKTKEQPGAKLGLEVDSLFDLTYPELAFDINNEKTQPPSGTFGLPDEVSIRYHHGLLAPTDEALDMLISDYINVPGGWGSIDRTPKNIVRIIVNAHMSINPVYRTDLEKGFYNGENDFIEIGADNVIHKEYGSNCTFIGLSKPIVPNAFSSVTGPVYLQPGYSTTMFAIEESGLLPALKRKNRNYSLFVESDISLADDSSLIYDPIRENFSLFKIQRIGGAKKFNVSINDLRRLLLNHVAIAQPKGIARKEFIANLSGNFIIFNHESGEVSGTDVTTIGYQGEVPAPNYPRKISNGTSNGDTYDINNWFSFNATDLYTSIQASYPTFFNLMKKAGLVLEREYRFSFISRSEFYTVFIPTDEALGAANVNALSIPDLKDLILLHFVQGQFIFTDGNMQPGYYETMRSIISGSQLTSSFTKVYIEPGINTITFKTRDGSEYTVIEESERTNKLTGVIVITPGAPEPVIPNVYNNAVIHEINRVLLVNDLDTE